MSGGGAEGERESQAGSLLSAQSQPGLDLMTQGKNQDSDA